MRLDYGVSEDLTVTFFIVVVLAYSELSNLFKEQKLSLSNLRDRNSNDI